MKDGKNFLFRKIFTLSYTRNTINLSDVFNFVLTSYIPFNFGNSGINSGFGKEPMPTIKGFYLVLRKAKKFTALTPSGLLCTTTKNFLTLLCLFSQHTNFIPWMATISLEKLIKNYQDNKILSGQA